MSIISMLLEKAGVIAAGEYAYRGDRFSFKGELSEEVARATSIMCRASTMSMTMEGRMLGAFSSRTGLHPVRGWVARGPGRTLCVVTNIFCLINNEIGSENEILRFMRENLADESMDLV